MPTARVLVTALALPALLLLSSCDSKSPTEPPGPSPTCSYQVTAPSDALPPEGGQLTLTITATASCGWSVRPGVDWISVVSGASGVGNGTSVVSVGPNGDVGGREGLVTVETASLRVSQRGRTACTYTLSTEEEEVGPAGGTGRFSLTTAEGCTWTATSPDDWVTVTPESGSGSAEISYVVAPYTGTVRRTTTIRVNERTVRVQQDPVAVACTYAVEPTEFALHWHHEGGEVRLTTAAGCRWTVKSTASWLTVTGVADREGSATVTFSTPPYTEDATRRAPIEFRWETATAGQNVWVQQEGCRYGMDQTPRTYGPAGDPDEIVNVVVQPISPSCNTLTCPWTATSDVSWIRITSPMPRAGDDMFRYAVDANTTGATRQGRIRVANLVLLITQTN